MLLDARALGRLTLVLAALALPASAAAQGGRDLDSPWQDGPGATPAVPPTSGAAPVQDVIVVAPSDEAAIPPPPPTGAYGAALGTSDRLRIPSTIATRLRALEGDLSALAQRGSGYIVDGVVQLLSSGISIAVGVLFLTASSSPTGDQMAAYLFSVSGVGVARGLLTLLLPVTPSESAVAYLHPTPMTSYREVRERLRAREDELHGLADAAMVGRVVDGSLGLASAAAMIPLFAVFGFNERDPYSYIMLLLAGVSAVTGTITLFSTSDAERRWSSYTELRDRLAVTATGAEDERWLEDHAEDEPIADARSGVDLTANVGLLGGSLRLSF